MRKREYIIKYTLKDNEIEDLFNTIELIAFLIYARFNKKIEIIQIREFEFAE